MRFLRALSIIFLISFLTIGCGSGGGDGKSDTGQNDTGNTDTSNTDTSIPDMSDRPVAMTPEDRVSTMTEISDFRKSLPGVNPHADNEALLAYLLTRDDIEDAGHSNTRGVWARFTDGLPILFINNRPKSDKLTSLYHKQTVIQGLALEFPGEDNAYVIDVENLARDATGHVAGYLVKKKYNVTGVIAGTVEQLRAIRNASVIYFSTHGDIAKGKDGISRYVLGTGTSFDGTDRPSQGGDLDTSDPDSWADYLDGSLVMVQYEEGSGAGHWGITERFIHRYWTLSKDALLFIDSCFSATEDPVIGNFRQILQGLGMLTFVGWDDMIGYSDAADAGRYLFDRVLGANDYLKEDPPQRPFNARDVYFDMRQRTLSDKNGRSKYISYEDLDDDGIKDEITTHLRVLYNDKVSILVPSIKKITVDEVEKTLTLQGEFGSEEGEVTIGENKLTPLSWMYDEIVLQSKTDSGYFSGEVMVKVREHESNKVPLTGWENVTITYTSDLSHVLDIGFEQKVECNMHFRADIHPYREEPGLAPVVPDSVFYYVAPHSTCTVSMKGENDSFKLYLPDTGSDAGAMTWVANEDAAGILKYFYMRGYLDAANYKLNILLGLGAQGKLLIKDENKPYPYPLTPDPTLFGQGMGTGQGFDLDMDSGFNVTADSKPGSIPGGILTDLEWGSMNANPIPQEGVTPSVTNIITIKKRK